MKKIYEKPAVEVEIYQLSAAIAACDSKVSLGPYIEGYNTVNDVCSDDYNEDNDGERTSLEDTLSTAALLSGNFYTQYVCSCYHSSGGTNIYTS